MDAKVFTPATRVDTKSETFWCADLKHGVSVMATGTDRVMLNLAFDSPCCVFQGLALEEADALADALRSAADFIRRRAA